MDVQIRCAENVCKIVTFCDVCIRVLCFASPVSFLYLFSELHK